VADRWANVIGALRELIAMVIRNHGLLAVHAEAAGTLVRAITAEDAACLYYNARSMEPKLLPTSFKEPV